jgi:hypothetical protein
VNGASLVVPWRSSVRQQEAMTYDSRKKQQNFACTEILCILEFTSEDDLINHISAGKHQYARIKSGMDNAILYYANQKQLQHSTEATTSRSSLLIADESKLLDYSRIYMKGWARKVRRVKKITAKQKNFILKLFSKGSLAKSKLSADQMAQLMKEEMVDGNYYFSPDECMEATKIRNLISRFKKGQGESAPKLIALTEEDGIDYNMDEICDSLFESDTEDLLEE